MNPVRLVTMAALFREVVLPAGVLAWLAAFGSAGLENTRATPITKHLAPSLAANAEFAVKPRALATDKWQAMAAASPPAIVADNPLSIATDAPQAVTIGKADAATASEAMTAATSDTTPTPHDAESIVTAALTDPSETLPSETPPAQAAVGTANPDAGDVKQAVGSVEILDECYVVDSCVDRYLWALYARTPKQDAVKEQEQRKVTVKRKGKLVTVTRTTTTVVEEDFAWKDPKAAERAGMSMPDYVIGGMDHDFKLRLFRMLLAAEQAGLSPGITSAFRDDYRQSIASGLRAASDRSYHGGSFRGGYGHGLAADVVSVKGDTRAQRQASSEVLWKWIDTHKEEFLVARPYQDRDPPHCGPLDGQEYATHNRAKKPQTARTDTKKRNQDDRGEMEPQSTAKSSKLKPT